MCPLSAAAEGEVLSVVRMGLAPGDVSRLGQMGLSNGGRVRIVKSDPGAVLVEACGARLAIGRAMAERIWVRPVDRGM